MAINVKIATRQPELIAPRDAVVGQHYRRSSMPNKLYVGARDPRNLSKCVLVSLTHGNVVSTKLDSADFIEVNLDVVVSDA